MMLDDGEPGNRTTRVSVAVGQDSAGSARWHPDHGGDTTVAAAARAWTRAVLQHRLAGRLQDRLADDIDLLVSELAANALVHAGGVEDVELTWSHTTLRIGVHDLTTSVPIVRRRYHPELDHGRGMLLVDLLAERWGVDQHLDDGKTVWLELTIRP